MEYLLIFVIGVVSGIAIAVLANWMRKGDAEKIAREALEQAESRRIKDVDSLLDRVRESFGTLSLNALSKNTEDFLKLANETLSKQTQAGEKDLDGKKELIDQTLAVMKEDLLKVRGLVTELEKDREKKFGQLSSQLESTATQTMKLQETATQLQIALSNTKARGQWGERMAEDVLRMAGFIEGINYQKQKVLETVGKRPDYTFLLPHDLKVNMDVKFPMDNYLRYIEAEVDSERDSYKNQFLKDVRSRVGEVLTRDYINPEENTVDYVIVFIPNEQIYAFMNENDRSLMDDALRDKVILCSPITLYAILAIIRQAVDNFNLEKTASEIMSLLGGFNKQWDAFVNSFDKMGRKIEEAQNEFNNLTSTRRNQLERSLRKIEDLRKQKDIPVALPDTGEKARGQEKRKGKNEDI
ncbi:MAG: DNA recombination protein RmuC [Syntrophobacterales bacterium]|nr:DNA recombination protein RmuC [Syntrophobacterales bacterium]